tara:strand:- start:72468 stop:72779 length:312 start_codon:yes stop_codon:yes gene_type:complete
MVLEGLHNQYAAIDAMACLYGARRILGCGSVARSHEQPDNDVDCQVGFSQVYDLFAQRLPQAGKLSELIGRKVYIVPEHELGPQIRQQVLDEAVDLWASPWFA